jgi:hypothetical protein
MQCISRDGNRPILDLRVAIRAHKHALLRLDPQLIESDGNSFGIELVTLQRRLDVMEVQRAHVSVESTDAARATCLRDLRDRHVRLDQPLQLLFWDATRAACVSWFAASSPYCLSQ